MYTGFDHARERFSLFKKKDHPSVLSTGERLALTLRPQVGEGKGDLVLFSGFAFIFDLLWRAALEVFNFDYRFISIII